MNIRGIARSIASVVALGAIGTARAAAEPPSPDFGPNVLIFDSSSRDAQKQINAIYAKQEKAQFGAERFALLFKPGKYDLDVEVGFYTHVAGLGRSPDEVEITGAVRAKAGWMKGNATCNFWRCVENLAITPTHDKNTNVWATSQGVSMRRVHVKGDLSLWDNGWSSGGFLADSKIDGKVVSGSQQQWLSRNDEWGKWDGGNWNMVFVGTNAPPSGSWPDKPYTVVEETPVIREKPFLTIDSGDRYSVVVPDLKSAGSRGVSWGNDPRGDKSESISIDQFFIARADRDNAETINTALATGKNLLLTPGTYHLKGAIQIDRPGTVVLGIGYPTLVADAGTAAMTVGNSGTDAGGVKIAGVLFEAGAVESPTLLEIGRAKSAVSHAADPVFLYDVYARAGGASAGSTKCFVTINSNDVVGDNFWLWRADHGNGAKWDENKNANGLIVNGDNVTVYGLFVEHTQEYQTLWNGNGGRVYMYQSEMPYDPPSQKAWSPPNGKGYASYKVGENVTTHEAWGLGVYCLFLKAPAIADNAIEAPAAPGVRFHHMIAIRLGGQENSGISHIINQDGEPVLTKMKSQLDEK